MGVIVRFLQRKMKVTLFLVLVGLSYSTAGPGPRFTCEECVHEMRELAFMIKFVAKDIQDYLTANYCPTLPEDDHACEHDLAHHYIGMLYSVVTHFFVDGAVHVCQTAGICDAANQREYTCDECIEGLQWVEAYMEDPIMVAEMVVYLQQNFCTDQMHHCHECYGHGEIYDSYRNMYAGTSLWCN